LSLKKKGGAYYETPWGRKGKEKEILSQQTRGEEGPDVHRMTCYRTLVCWSKEKKRRKGKTPSLAIPEKGTSPRPGKKEPVTGIRGKGEERKKKRERLAVLSRERGGVDH